MENPKMIESLGFVVKKETLALLAAEHKFNELILEDLDPYPGFYDHFHIPLNEKEKKPRSIFAITKELSFEQMNDFIRMTRNIKKTFTYKFDAVMARLTFQNEMVTALRIYMDDYSALPQLIEMYKRNGTVFTSAKNIKPYSSLIQIWKFMVLEEIVPTIFKDTELPDTYYFRVKNYVNWNKFESITHAIRNNNNHKVYDAAQAGYYSPDGIFELVRIYDQKATLDNLKFLKEKYEVEIERALFQLANT
ncbi:MAG TPA: hypothetical protein VK212_02030 [Lentimicrobium sp.]|nr:hypothetical protein [Lentimicrobium sp.]